MAAPSFVQASTGATDATGAFTFTGVTTGTVGHIVIMQIYVDGTGAISWGTLSAANIEALDGTADTWTLIGTYNVGNPSSGQQRLYIGRRTSASSAPTFVASANTSGDDVYGRMYEFSDVATGTTLATVIENAVAGSVANDSNTTTSVTDVAVTSLGPDRLALNFVALSDDAMGLAAFAGETGGNWTLPVAIYETATGTDATIALNTSLLGILQESHDTSYAISGETGTSEQEGQSFLASTTGNLSSISVLVLKNNSPADDLILDLQTDSAGVPSGTVLGSASIPAADVPTSATWLQFSITAAVTASQTYWIVLRRSGGNDTTNNYSIRGSGTNNYADGTRAVRNSGTWTTFTGDYAFRVAYPTDTINGGSDTITSIGWGVVGFALIGTTVVSGVSLILEQGFVDFNDPGVL